MSEPLYVPESLPAPQLLRLMKEQRIQLAVVIDEYGGTAGIVSLQDLIEELIGDVDDEEPDEQPAPGTVVDPAVIDGLTPILDAMEEYGLDFGDEDELDVDTVGGYVFHRLGRVAVVGDEVTLPGGARLRVEDIDGLRVSRVRILPPETPEPIVDFEPKVEKKPESEGRFGRR